MFKFLLIEEEKNSDTILATPNKLTHVAHLLWHEILDKYHDHPVDDIRKIHYLRHGKRKRWIQFSDQNFLCSVSNFKFC